MNGCGGCAGLSLCEVNKEQTMKANKMTNELPPEEAQPEVLGRFYGGPRESRDVLGSSREVLGRS